MGTLVITAGNWLRTITSDQTVYYNSSLSSRTWNYWEVINLLFALPISFYLSILKTEKNITILERKIPAQEVKQRDNK